MPVGPREASCLEQRRDMQHQEDRDEKRRYQHERQLRHRRGCNLAGRTHGEKRTRRPRANCVEQVQDAEQVPGDEPFARREFRPALESPA